MGDGEIYPHQLWNMVLGMAYGQRVWQWGLRTCGEYTCGLPLLQPATRRACFLNLFAPVYLQARGHPHKIWDVICKLSSGLWGSLQSPLWMG